MNFFIFSLSVSRHIIMWLNWWWWRAVNDTNKTYKDTHRVSTYGTLNKRYLFLRSTIWPNTFWVSHTNTANEWSRKSDAASNSNESTFKNRLEKERERKRREEEKRFNVKIIHLKITRLIYFSLQLLFSWFGCWCTIRLDVAIVSVCVINNIDIVNGNF